MIAAARFIFAPLSKASGFQALNGFSLAVAAPLAPAQISLISSYSQMMPTIHGAASVTTTIVWGFQSTKLPQKNTIAGPITRKPRTIHNIDLRSLDRTMSPLREPPPRRSSWYFGTELRHLSGCSSLDLPAGHVRSRSPGMPPKSAPEPERSALRRISRLNEEDRYDRRVDPLSVASGRSRREGDSRAPA
jgi:hypothetical protein